MTTVPKRYLGGLGPLTSAQGLGCMGMSEFYGETNEAESIATIRRALDLGVNFLDTADVYGPHKNEVLVGNAIRDRRDQVLLATKFGIVRDPSDPRRRGVNGKPEYVKASCDASLQRLGLDHIDLYYQHRVDPETPIEETVGAMSDLVKAGKIRYLGLSEASGDTLRRAYKVHSIMALQSEWSLWSRDIELDSVPTCRELDIAVVAYSPLGRGFLTGQIKRFDDLAANDFRRFQPRFQGDNFAKNLELVEQVRAMGAEKGCTAGQLALAWVHAQGSHVFPIPGTKRRTYLEENVAALDIDLTADEMHRLNAILPPGAVAGERYPDMRLIGGESAPARTSG